MKRCPFCQKEIQDAAVLCKYCNRDLRDEAPPESEMSKQTDKEDAIKEAIHRMPHGQWFGRKELKELPSILWEDELPERIVQGFYKNGNGILVSSNKRLVFIDKGMLGGLKVEDFPYDKISSLEYSTGMLMGSITVYASGNRAKIDNIQKGEVKEFAEYVRARVTAISESKASPPTASPTPAAASPSGDLMEQLEKLAGLRKEGLLDDEEFAAAKKKLLS